MRKTGKINCIIVKDLSRFGRDYIDSGRYIEKIFPSLGIRFIAINDNYADGRDMSWLWDVDFDSLREEGVSYISGVRAYDMAVRLQYDDVPVVSVDTDITKALRGFIAAHPSSPKRIYCTYTAMLALRRELAKMTDVEAIG